MITVTDRAAKELRRVLVDHSAPPGQGIKLVPNPEGGISLRIAPPGEGDEVARRGRALILIIDHRLTREVDGLVFDVRTNREDGAPHKQFTLTSPCTS